mmetsp:Transcript_26683/g.43634  ORF Transcript_26683/g.43634 Transcript_26683/m.43634 type:complete len:654 (+) Transcript_26683:104-2065(+)
MDRRNSPKSKKFRDPRIALGHVPRLVPRLRLPDDIEAISEAGDLGAPARAKSAHNICHDSTACGYVDLVLTLLQTYAAEHWNIEHRGFASGLQVPPTVLYKGGALAGWYYTDPNSGYLHRKKKAECKVQNIAATFSQETPGCEIVAFYLSVDKVARDGAGTEQLKFEYFDAARLQSFLFRSKSEDGVLQKYIVPSDHELTYRATWTPHCFLLDRRMNVNHVRDVKLSRYARCVTFHGPDFMSTPSTLFASTTLSAKFRRVVDEIVAILEAMRPAMKARLLVLNFKVDSRDKIWLLWCSALRMADESGQSICQQCNRVCVAHPDSYIDSLRARHMPIPFKQVLSASPRSRRRHSQSASPSRSHSRSPSRTSVAAVSALKSETGNFEKKSSKVGFGAIENAEDQKGKRESSAIRIQSIFRGHQTRSAIARRHSDPYPVFNRIEKDQAQDGSFRIKEYHSMSKPTSQSQPLTGTMQFNRPRPPSSTSPFAYVPQPLLQNGVVSNRENQHPISHRTSGTRHYDMDEELMLEELPPQDSSEGDMYSSHGSLAGWSPPPQSYHPQTYWDPNLASAWAGDADSRSSRISRTAPIPTLSYLNPSPPSRRLTVQKIQEDPRHRIPSALELLDEIEASLRPTSLHSPVELRQRQMYTTVSRYE